MEPWGNPMHPKPIAPCASLVWVPLPKTSKAFSGAPEDNSSLPDCLGLKVKGFGLLQGP